MSDICSTSEVGQLVAERPHLARVFEQLKIDYCCGGDLTLGDACKQANLEAATALETIKAADTEPEPVEGPDWLDAPLADLCSHIERTHHAYLREELPRLTELISKVVNAHADRHRELNDVQQVFAALRAELEPHMMKEEQVLFPAVRQIESASQVVPMPFGSVANPIHCMEQEHDVAGAALKRLRELTSDYQPPEDACNTYRVMLDGLQRLEADMHQHVHKENNILFPRVMRLEASRASA